VGGFPPTFFFFLKGKETLFMRIRLIQRGKIIPFADGSIDNLIRWDYMGSAEFEFGALRRALDDLSGKLHLMQIFPVYGVVGNKTGEYLTVCCLPKDFKEIELFWYEDYLGEPHSPRLKEITFLNYVLGGVWIR
jgi:hypothetical protein